MSTSDVPMVDVLMLTYNQKDFVSQAIESVLSQRTRYSYRLIIGDDCSSDGTSAIVSDYARKYPDKILALINPKNLGMFSNFMNVLQRINAKYTAFCEGDDFWNSQDKLEMQVDFLESHSDYSFVYSDHSFSNGKGQTIHSRKRWRPQGNIRKKLLYGNFIVTCTVCCRSSLLLVGAKDLNPNWIMLDYPLWLYMANAGTVKYFPERLGTYRILEESASHSKDINKMFRFARDSLRIKTCFVKRYNRSMLSREELLLSYYVTCLRFMSKNKRHPLSKKLLSKSILLSLRTGNLFQLIRAIFFYMCSRKDS